MDYTMLRQICRRGRLEALLHDGALDEDLRTLYSTLLPADIPHPTPRDLGVSSEAQAKFLQSAPRLSDDDYQLLLNHVNRGGLLWHDCNTGWHAHGALIFPPNAKPLTTITHSGRNFSTYAAHPGNSCVYFLPPAQPGQPASGEYATGFITKIWQVLLPPKYHIIVQVNHHTGLRRVEDRIRGPYRNLPEFQTKIVSLDLGNHVLISLGDIIGQCVFWRRPRGTYSIDEDFYVVNFGLHRGRKVEQ